MKMKIIACCIMAALQQCCFARGGGGGGFGGVMRPAEVGPPVTTTGTVFDPSGAPDSNAVLAVWQSSRSIATAHPDAGGKYSIQWEAPSAREAAAARANAAQIKSTLIVREQARNFVAIRDLDETNAQLDLHLVEGLNVCGSVQDSEGKPFGGISVQAGMRVKNRPGMLGMLEEALTDAQGSFNFKGLPQEQDYFLYVNKPQRTFGVDGPLPISGAGSGYALGSGTLAAKDARTNHYAFPVFVLKKADRKVAGHVLNGDNKPLAGTTLSLSGEGQPWLSLSIMVRTDRQGHFAVDGLCEGPLKFSVINIRERPGGGRTPATLNAVNGQEIRAGDTNLVLKLGDKPPGTNAPQPAL